MKTVLRISQGLDYPVELATYAVRSGRVPRYRVTYGADVRDNLTHAAAASELGFAIMHSLECKAGGSIANAEEAPKEGLQGP